MEVPNASIVVPLCSATYLYLWIASVERPSFAESSTICADVVNALLPKSITLLIAESIRCETEKAAASFGRIP